MLYLARPSLTVRWVPVLPASRAPIPLPHALMHVHHASWVPVVLSVFRLVTFLVPGPLLYGRATLDHAKPRSKARPVCASLASPMPALPSHALPRVHPARRSGAARVVRDLLVCPAPAPPLSAPPNRYRRRLLCDHLAIALWQGVDQCY